MATHLLLADSAFIADWVIANGKITSKTNTADGTPHAQLDGQNGAIVFASDISRWTETNGSQSVKQTVKIDSQLAQVEARAGNDVAYVSSQGIFVNRAGMDALPASLGVRLKGAVVGLGYGSMNKDSFGSSYGIAGVIGLSQNSSSNPAPAFGGYFFNLMAKGLNLAVKQISADYYPVENDCYLSCYNTAYITIYFNPPMAEGKIYYIRINNSATVNLNTYANGGKKILMPNGSLVNSASANVRGELITLIWDGQYWLYSTTAV